MLPRVFQCCELAKVLAWEKEHSGHVSTILGIPRVGFTKILCLHFLFHYKEITILVLNFCFPAPVFVQSHFQQITFECFPICKMKVDMAHVPDGIILKYVAMFHKG